MKFKKPLLISIIICGVIWAAVPFCFAKDSMGGAGIQATVFVIHASKDGEYIDDKISSIVANFEALSYTSYRLLSRSEQVIGLRNRARFPLPGKNGELTIKPTDHYSALDESGKPCEVIQINAQMPSLKTTLRLYNGATVVIGGMPYNGGALLVALKAVAMPLGPGERRRSEPLAEDSTSLKSAESVSAGKTLPAAKPVKPAKKTRDAKAKKPKKKTGAKSKK